MLRKTLAVITAGWFLSLIGALLLAFLIWFLGDLIAVAGFVPLESDLARLLAVIVILVVWGLHNLAKILRSRQDNERLTAAIVDSETASSAAAAAAEIAALRQRFSDALAALRKGRRTGLYELPWYVIIGPPGAGKTTALLNSGLHFPLGQQDRAALRGTGGTRNCEWLFTNEAVLIDTAGRYTTQDSNLAVDQAAWRGFLALLKKHRPRQPINGALVAVSIADLAAGTAAEIEAHGRAVRARLSELHHELGVRFPVYILLTKADLVAGFVEFFDDLRREDREQVWGFTLPYSATAAPEASPLAGFDRDYAELLQRLATQTIGRVEQEQDGERKRRIFGFADQMATLRQPVRAFLDTAFAHSRYDEQPLLRGVYFTSGTQEGTPIDRVMSALAANFGIERQRLAPFSGQGRSYFLTRLLHQVVFPEAALVGANWRQELRRRWTARGALAASAAAIVFGVLGWWVSFEQNQAALGETSASAEKYRSAVDAVGVTALARSDLARIEPVLSALHALRIGGRGEDETVPLSMTLGLYQGNKIAAQVDRKYHNALNWVLLPRLLERLEETLRQRLDNEEFLYTTLKVYLMLGGQGKLDAELVRDWHVIDWDATYPGQAAAPARAALEEHLVELLVNFAPGHPIDMPLVEQVRRRLLALSPGQLAFVRLRQDPAVVDLNDWRLSDEGGALVARVFRRGSGAAAKDVPGLFTYYGLHEVFLPLVDAYAKETAEDAWILGERAGQSATDPLRLARDMNELYRGRFISEWQALLDDLEIRQVGNLRDVVDVLSNMTVPNSPLKQVLAAIARETAISAPPPPTPPGGAGKAGAKIAGKAAAKLGLGKLAKIATKATKLLGIPAAAPAADPFWRQIDDRFRPLHELALAPEGKPVPIDDLIKKLDLVRTEINTFERANTPNAPLQTAGKAGQMLSDLMSQYPPPVSRWLATLTRSSAEITSLNLQQQVTGLWQTDTLRRCREAVNNRYPFFTSPDDITIFDFGLIFGPGGALDKFFKDNIEAFVDRSSETWRWKPSNGLVPGTSQEALNQFQRAAKIRDSFFRGPGAPVVSFTVSPVELVPAATQAMLEIDGKQLLYRNDAVRPTEFVWPGGANAPKGFRLVVTPIQGAPRIATENGDWAFFRMLTKARIEADRLAERFDVTFTIDTQAAKYRFSANSVFSNLNLDALQKFRCPDRL